MAESGPSPSCRAAFTSQVSENLALIAEVELESALVGAQLDVASARLNRAQSSYENAYGRAERAIGSVVANEASRFYDAFVAPRARNVRELGATLARERALSVEVARATDAMIARGPQRTGECAAPYAHPDVSGAPPTISPADPSAAPRDRNPGPADASEAPMQPGSNI